MKKTTSRSRRYIEKRKATKWAEKIFKECSGHFHFTMDKLKDELYGTYCSPEMFEMIKPVLKEGLPMKPIITGTKGMGYTIEESELWCKMLLKDGTVVDQKIEEDEARKRKEGE